MKNNFIPFILLILCFLGCKHKSVEEQEVPLVTTAQSLSYSPNTISLVNGSNGFSNTPSISPEQDYNYSLTTKPNTDAITIDTDGKIIIDNTLATGSYSIDVSAAKGGKTRTFLDVFTITITDAPVKPSNLNYSVDSLVLESGSTGASTTPTVEGTAPFSYAVSSNPSSGEISISNAGVINTTSNLPLGTYYITVTVTNPGGSTVYDSIYKVEVKADVPSTFTNDVLPVIQAKCASCHTSTGGSLPNWTDYNNSKTNINNILDRIQRTEGTPGAMPQGRTMLSSATIAKFQKWLDDGLLE